MTQEEKVRAYDKALSVALETYKTQPMYMDWLEKMFPELKESENEMVRKALINGFNKLDKSAVWYNGVTNGQILDWLEKQSEQKFTDKEIKELLRTEYEKGRADSIAEMQKPWSEEEEKIINGITSYLCTHDSCELDGFDKWYDFLKSLKDRIQPQQEKEEILGKLEEWLDEYISNLADVGTDTLIGSFRKYLDGKLPIKPKSQWKPSEKLLDVFIKNAIDFFESNFNPLTDGGVIGAFDDKEKMIEEFKEYMKEEGFNEEWI